MSYKDYNWENNNFTNAHKYLLTEIIKYLPDKNSIILDFGCGNGSIACFLINLGYNVYGIDPSIKGIEIAKRSFSDKFFVFNIETNELPLELKSINFDFIISTEVIEHLYDPRSYIYLCKKILFRNLNKGGKLLITTPYHGYLKNLIISLLGKMDKHFTVLWDGGHIKFWSYNTINSLLIEYNFVKIKFAGCGRAPFLWKSMLLLYEI